MNDEDKKYNLNKSFGNERILDDPYTLQELLNRLEKMHDMREGVFNDFKAFYCLAQEIKKIDRHLGDIMEMYRNLRLKQQSSAACQVAPWTQDDNLRCHP